MLNKYYILFLLLTCLTFGIFEKAVAQDNAASASQQSQMVVVDGWGADIDVRMIPKKPHLNDEVTIECILTTSNKNLPESKVEFKLVKGARLVSGQKVNILPPLNKGESAMFSIRIRAISRLLQVRISAAARVRGPRDELKWMGFRGKTIDMVVLAENDTISYEQFGNDLEIWRRIGPEYLYDIDAGARMQSLGSAYDDEAKRIRAEIQELKELDATLSDWDALELLHNVRYDMVWRYGVHDSEEAILILIQARKLTREEGLSKWKAVEQIIEEKKGRIDFFRDDNTLDIDYISSDNSSPKDRITTTFIGTWFYNKNF